jgi:general secretion pathway protein I
MRAVMSLPQSLRQILAIASPRFSLSRDWMRHRSSHRGSGAQVRAGARGRFRGFTLIEVLVAFAILAVTLTALLQVFSTGLRSIMSVERYASATLLARSALAEVGTEIPLAPGERSASGGDGFAWRVRITPALAPLQSPGGMVIPYQVAVTVTWPQGALTLTTLRLAALAVAPGEETGLRTSP